MFRRYEFNQPIGLRRTNLPWAVRWLVLAVALGAATAIAAYAFEIGRRLAGSTESLWAVQAAHKVELDRLDEQVKMLDAAVKASKSTSTQGNGISDVERSIAGIQAEFAEMQKRQARIEAVLLADAAKALEVPLILRDIESMKQNQQIAQAALRQDVERLFVLGLGIAGILLTGFVGLFFAPRPLREERNLDQRQSAP